MLHCCFISAPKVPSPLGGSIPTRFEPTAWRLWAATRPTETSRCFPVGTGLWSPLNAPTQPDAATAVDGSHPVKVDPFAHVFKPFCFPLPAPTARPPPFHSSSLYSTLTSRESHLLLLGFHRAWCAPSGLSTLCLNPACGSGEVELKLLTLGCC